MAAITTPRKRRRIRKILAVALFLSAAVVAALPWLLSTAPARVALSTIANHYLSPSRVEVGSLGLSWTGPLRLSGLTLHDPKGKRVIAVSKASLNRNLIQLLLDRSRLGTLTLDGALVDVERRADGSIDLLDIIPKTNSTKPTSTARAASPASALPQITLKVVGGSLKLQTPELPDPFVADRLDLILKVPGTSGPLSLDLKAEQGTGENVATLAIVGRYDQKTPSDLDVTVTGTRWPWSADASGVVARGRLDGRVEAKRGAGLWTLSGDARLLDLVAEGAALSGDRVKLDQVAASWEVGQTSRAWSVHKLDLNSPVATISGEGTLTTDPGASARIEGRIDLAALARQLPHTLRLRDGLVFERGEASVKAGLTTVDDGQRCEVNARLSDLIAREPGRTITLHDPATLSARVIRRAKNVHVEQLVAKTDFLDVDGSGDLDSGVKIKGSLDLAALQSQLRDLLDLGAIDMAGQGRWVADYRRIDAGYAARMAAEFRGLDVKGMTSDPIHRDLARVDAVVRGTATESGLPGDWARATLNLKANPTGMALLATSQNGAMTLTVSGSTPVSLSGRDATAGAKVSGRWAGGVLDLDELRVNLRETGPAATPALDLAVRGRFDRAAGDLTLTPLPGTSTSAIGLADQGFRASGLGKPGAGPKIEGAVSGDLAALDKVLCLATGAAPYGLMGKWGANVAAEPSQDGRLRLDVNLGSADIAFAASDPKGRQLEGPIGVSLKGWYKTSVARLDVEGLTVGTRYGVVTASGRLNDPTGRRLIDVQGNLAPNWPMVKVLVASSVEPGATVQGGATRSFRIRGALSGSGTSEILKGLDAEVGVDLTEFKAFGMALGATPLILRCSGGRTVIDPIQTTLNKGRVDLRPEFILDDPKGLAMVLAPGSAITGAEINPEVTRRVLAYVAPVLQEATEASGRVSANFQKAEFPIGGDASRTSTVTGQIVFDNVEFGAGPMAAELLKVTGRQHGSTLRLHQPLQLAIANGRINQSGLEVPISADSKIVVKGSIGFDQTLALNADVPIGSAMLGQQAGLDGLVGKGTTIPIPIGGTLSRPTIDQRALRVALGKAGESILKRGTSQEAADLIKRFSRNSGGGGPRPVKP